MKYRIALVCLILLFAEKASSAPFLVSDPDPTGGSDKCVYQRGSDAPVETPLAVVPPSTLIASCKIDLASMPAGVSNLQVWFKSSLWGVESTKSPFSLTKPAAGSPGPTNLRIAP